MRRKTQMLERDQYGIVAAGARCADLLFSHEVKREGPIEIRLEYSLVEGWDDLFEIRRTVAISREYHLWQIKRQSADLKADVVGTLLRSLHGAPREYIGHLGTRDAVEVKGVGDLRVLRDLALRVQKPGIDQDYLLGDLNRPERSWCEFIRDSIGGPSESEALKLLRRLEVHFLGDEKDLIDAAISRLGIIFSDPGEAWGRVYAFLNQYADGAVAIKYSTLSRHALKNIDRRILFQSNRGIEVSKARTDNERGERQVKFYAFLRELLDSPGPPSAEDLVDRLKRAELPVLVESGMEHVGLQTPLAPHIEAWIAAYEVARISKIDSSAGVKWPTSLYVATCAADLLGLGRITSVPLSVVGEGRSAQVLELVIESFPGLGSCLFRHPSFPTEEGAFGVDFIDDINKAWTLAAPPEAVADNTAVLWSIRKRDGLPLGELDNLVLANGAVFLTFWHLRRGLGLDNDVYILADCHIDGSIRPVSRLEERIEAVRKYHTNEIAPTLVLSSDLGGRELGIFPLAQKWCQIEAVSNIEDLIRVRSVAVEASVVFLTRLAERLDNTPWLRNGKSVSLSEVFVPPSVWKEERNTLDQAYVWDRTDNSIPSASGESRRANKRSRVLWQQEFERVGRNAPLLVIGGPGFGKSSLISATARQMAIAARTDLESRTGDINEVSWPVVVSLDKWAREDGPTLESLCAAVFMDLPEEWSVHYKSAAMSILRRRIGAESAHTFLFLDGLDQVGEAFAASLRRRLDEISHFNPRIVFTTRESGLRRRAAVLPFSDVILLRIASLSPDEADRLIQSWLGSASVAKVAGYLRSQSSLAVVADSPLLLTLACMVALVNNHRTLPGTAAKLYQQMMRYLALGAWRHSSPSYFSEGSVDEFLARMQLICWQLFCRAPGVSEFDLEVLVGGIVAATRTTSSEAYLMVSRLVDLGFLEASSGQDDVEITFHFSHATFLEFLAAWHLASQIGMYGWAHAEVDVRNLDKGLSVFKASEVLNVYALEPVWEPVIIFVACLLKDCAPLFEMLGDRTQDDLYRHRLSLFCRCFGTIDPGAEKSISNVTEGAFRELRMIGVKSGRRRPDRWRRWLEDIGNLLASPTIGRKVITLLTELDSRHHEMSIHGAFHEIVEILARRAYGLNGEFAVDALLSYSTGEGRFEAGEDAAKALVRMANEKNDMSYVEALSEYINNPNGDRWRQVKIAEVLLNSCDPHVVDDVFDFIVRTARDKEVESWIRSSAIRSVVAALGGPHEVQAAALIGEILWSTMADFNNRRDLASGILWLARTRQSDIIDLLLLMSIGFAEVDGLFASQVAESFPQFKDSEIMRQALAHLWSWATSPETDCYPRVRSLQSLLAGGTPIERRRAVEKLKGMVEQPITDGRQQWLAIEALLNAGEPYEGFVREQLARLASAPKVRSHWLLDIGEVALELRDQDLLSQLRPFLLAIIHGKKPNEADEDPGWSEKGAAAQLLRGTQDWIAIERSAMASLYEQRWEDREKWDLVNIVAFSAPSSDLLEITEHLLSVGRRNYKNFRPWHPLLRELGQRGWRFNITIDRKIRVLRAGQEEARPDASFGY